MKLPAEQDPTTPVDLELVPIFPKRGMLLVQLLGAVGHAKTAGGIYIPDQNAGRTKLFRARVLRLGEDPRPMSNPAAPVGWDYAKDDVLVIQRRMDVLELPLNYGATDMMLVTDGHVVGKWDEKIATKLDQNIEEANRPKLHLPGGSSEESSGSSESVSAD